MKVWWLVLGLAGAAAAPWLAGCSDDNGNGGFGADADAGADTGDPFGNGAHNLSGITVTPATAQLEILNGTIVTQGFTATANFSDGSSQPLPAGVSWSADQPPVGAIDAKATFTPSGQQGGLVTISASYMGKKGTASLAVKLHDAVNPANAAAAVQGALKGATAADAKVVWAYPYDKTVFPRGLDTTPLMWNGGGAGDLYYVHITSTYFEYESFTSAPPPSQVALAGTEWTKFVDSTSGNADLFVNRWDGMSATKMVHHTWTIAPASLRGTVYYWANNLGRILRLKPGGTPEDFSNGIVPAAPSNANCTMTCHAVSADGSTLVSGGGTFGGSYDLEANKTIFAAPNGISQWLMPALTPDGKYLLVNGLTGNAGYATAMGMFSTKDGSPAPATGVPNELMFMPAFAPDGSGVVFVTGSNPGTPYWDSTGTPGTLKAIDYDAKAMNFSNERALVMPGSDPSKQLIAWPTVAPDGKSAVYERINWQDPSVIHNLGSFVPPTANANTSGDLYVADLKTGTEVRLGNLDGDGYPFAAGSRDLGRNYEPSFAPVAAGGYFWVVFHSRRTFGNALTGDIGSVKQLWIAAIDQNPKPGQDPSHPAFHLPGQAMDTLNLRGYFALDPCKQDGASCSSGTDCCGGYCDPSPDGGAPVCGPKTGCSNDGDHCDTSSDCCNASVGVTCINHVCSEAPPN